MWAVRWALTGTSILIVYKQQINLYTDAVILLIRRLLENSNNIIVFNCKEVQRKAQYYVMACPVV